MDGMYSLYSKLLSTENKSIAQVRQDVNLLLELIQDSTAEVPNYYNGISLEQQNVILQIFQSRAKSLLKEADHLTQWLDVELQSLLTHDELKQFAQQLFNQLKKIVGKWDV